MSGSTFLFYVSAVVFALLAIIMAFTPATHMELAGLWLAAAIAFGVANILYGEETRLQPTAC